MTQQDYTESKLHAPVRRKPAARDRLADVFGWLCLLTIVWIFGYACGRAW